LSGFANKTATGTHASTGGRSYADTTPSIPNGLEFAFRFVD
jgi:hypothetical protein